MVSIPASGSILPIPSITTLFDPLTLPENYTIEFDVVPQAQPPSHNNSYFNFYLISTIKPKDPLFGLARPGGTGVKLSFAYSHFSAYYSDGTPDVKSTNGDAAIRQKAETKYHISIWVQKQRIRVYQDEVKIFDLLVPYLIK